MARFAELSESELSTILEEKVQKTPKRQLIKVTLNIFRGYLHEKGFVESRAFDIKTTKVKLANACMSN